MVSASLAQAKKKARSLLFRCRCVLTLAVKPGSAGDSLLQRRASGELRTLASRDFEHCARLGIAAGTSLVVATSKLPKPMI